MLEEPALLVQPWLPAQQLRWPAQTASAAWARLLINANTDARVGCALWHGSTRRGWLAPVASRKIEVFESEDLSLLVTLWRPWGIFRSWQIHDAEENQLGQIAGTTLRDGNGARLASLRQSADSRERSWISMAGLELGSWHVVARDDLIFRFGEVTERNPFLRMVVLAGLLALPPHPACQSRAH